ncbi:Type I restriction modification DNA specificity domain protein [Synechococcus sp. PCC 7335]|uniref:restriction endonuclease subunit S n=1 Tax=Synechococcus sp. (strain ATCC 29403 / PCC 7335) TaxID=91464 RepID=UPI00017ECB79|nr:restriction endonuclease subunit S [Synechococcus sp. PCC 7335]EDX82664.1 Type I restriction modification DNA specificity domain protein [Synechococcus sp. PCC 7335]
MNLPHDWKLVSLSEIASSEKGAIRRGPFGGSLKKSMFVESGFKVYEQQNAIRDDFQIGHYFINDEKYKEMEGFSVKPRDLIISCAGTIGRIAIVPDSAEPGVINQALMRIRPDTNVILVRYLKWLLESPTYQRDIFGKSAGSALKNLAAIGEIKKCKIPLPPIKEQRRIAAILDKADAVRRKRKEAIALTEDLLRSVFLDFMESVSNDCRKVSFKDVTLESRNSFVNGPFGSNLLTSELQSEGVPVIYIRDIREGVYNRVSQAFVTKEKAKELAACNVFPGDVLIAKVGDPPGTAAIYPLSSPNGIVTQDVVRMRLDLENATPEFIAAYINSQIGKHTLKPIIVEATRSRFPLGAFKNLVVTLPPLEDQQRFSKQYKKIRHIQNFLHCTCEQENNLFHSLLQRAFRGDL